MTVTEIAEEHGVSRQTVHAYRRRGIFPQPVEGKGSTRPRFRADEVAAFFSANPKRPGKRTDLVSQPRGETGVTNYVLTMRVEADSDVSPEEIHNGIHDARENVPFSFEILNVAEKQRDGD
ncbi:helix-turn-helix transcriptional regulator [Streptomyces albus]|uniref:helix-turn-helix transcriptional regulator n=1 Tax=Streptomyces albus TaxID=1888 RepID=UPI0037022475